MDYSKDISVIIPCWRGAAHYLPRLISSIPTWGGVEIIVVDNSKEPLRREEINTEREILLLHSSPDRHAGGSRNEGIANAKGKWLLFADADDYFTDDAFYVFNKHINSEAEIIYTKPEGRYDDTNEISGRGDTYAELVHGYCIGTISEEDLRIGFGTPWCKMVSHALVDRENLRFDEIRACNDIYFSLTSGYFAKTIQADDITTYIVTVNRGSLTQRRDYEVIKARLYGKLHCNQFLKDHGLAHRQRSVMYFLSESRHFGIRSFLDMLGMIITARQNPFVGWKRWGNTAGNIKKLEKKNKQYVVR